MTGAVTVVAGIPIPSNNPAFLAVVGKHVCLGLIGAIAGVGAMFSLKCTGRHPRVRLGLLLVYVRIVRDGRCSGPWRVGVRITACSFSVRQRALPRTLPAGRDANAGPAGGACTSLAWERRINPDFTVTWQSSARLQFYAEVYGQSHTGHGQGWGSDADGGLQYLVTPRFEVDLEEGVKIQGNLGSFSHYTGVGTGLLF
jgi:hypothetical protein